MPTTYPNQRTITIHREPIKSDFLGIKNENWQAAARDLGAHSLMLYLYFASNSNNYKLALSPVAIRQAIGMPRSTYQDQFARLVDKGYLVQTNGNTYNFFEKPQPSHASSSLKKQEPTNELNFENCTPAVNSNTSAVQNKPSKDIEINKHIKQINNINKQKFATNGLPITTEIYKPKEMIITIPEPTIERIKQ